MATAQPVAKPLAFEVVSVKPSTLRVGSFSINLPPGGRFSARNVTVRILLRTAYNVQEHAIQGGPDRLSTAGFDVEAKPAAGAIEPSHQQVLEMLKTLLADTFHLVLHSETVQKPAYVLVVGKNTPKLASPAASPDPKAHRFAEDRLGAQAWLFLGPRQSG